MAENSEAAAVAAPTSPVMTPSAPPPAAPKSGFKKFVSTVTGMPMNEGSPRDELLLAQQGYKQETPRQFNVFTTIMVNISSRFRRCFRSRVASFCPMTKLYLCPCRSSVDVCVLLNIPLFGFVVNTGGFYTLNIIWWIVGFAMINLALSLAELCSAMPVMGSLYMFSYKLGGEKWGPFAAWVGFDL